MHGRPIGPGASRRRAGDPLPLLPPGGSRTSPCRGPSRTFTLDSATIDSRPCGCYRARLESRNGHNEWQLRNPGPRGSADDKHSGGPSAHGPGAWAAIARSRWSRRMIERVTFVFLVLVLLHPVVCGCSARQYPKGLLTSSWLFLRPSGWAWSYCGLPWLCLLWVPKASGSPEAVQGPSRAKGAVYRRERQVRPTAHSRRRDSCRPAV